MVRITSGAQNERERLAKRGIKIAAAASLPKPYRKALKHAAVASKQGIRAIRELITLAISELEASQAFRKQVDVGPLPVKEPRPVSEAQRQALQAGREQRHADVRRLAGDGEPRRMAG